MMRYLEECLEGISTPSILEVGAGTGRYSVTLAKQGRHVTAVELIEHNLEILKSKLEGTEPVFRNERRIEMIQVYCYSKCSTCRKALQWLDAHGVAHEVIDIKADHPDEAALRRYYALSGLPLKRFFNTSGIQYREQELSKRLPGMSEDEQLHLLASDGMLVKRPLVVGEDFVLTGFKETEWEAKLL